MNFLSPQAPGDFKQRDQLLTESLRPDPLPFAIHEEYPIVLNPAYREFSHVLEEDGEIIAHANLWPRVIQGRTKNMSIPIGLIGNVATSAKKRSQGYMSKLMDHLKHKSTQMGLNALILWSDLLPFYQNLGFSSLGREFRFFFARGDLTKLPHESCGLREIAVNTIGKKHRQNWLSRRFATTYTLDRSDEEFSAMLQIPMLRIFALEGGTGERYFLLGKGYDMVGVIHEWGAPSPLDLACGVRDIMAMTGFEAIVVLAPGSMSPGWVKELSQYAVKCETHPMALCHQLKQGTQLAAILRELFIWGLDSI